MQIEIDGETERLFRSALATGQYESAEEIVAELAKQLQVGAAEDFLQPLPEHLDIDDVARKQGVDPISDFRQLKADFGPPDETSEEFLS